MAAKPYGEWQTVDWVRYIGEIFAFILIFITFTILAGSVHSANIVHGCASDAKAGKVCSYISG